MLLLCPPAPRGGGGRTGSFDQCLGVGSSCEFDTLTLFKAEKQNGMSIVLTIPGWGKPAYTMFRGRDQKNHILSSGTPQYWPHKAVTLPSGGGGACLALPRPTVAQYSSTIARWDYWTSPDVIFLGSSLSERDAEATRAHVRTRPHDTFSRFAILACACLVFASWGWKLRVQSIFIFDFLVI